jgi:hypothetical protein
MVVSSNSENISCVAFLKHKNSRKYGTDTVASCQQVSSVNYIKMLRSVTKHKANGHGASKIIDTFETYQRRMSGCMQRRLRELR